MAFNQRVGRAVLELSIDGGTFVQGAADAKKVYRDMAKGMANAFAEVNRETAKFSGKQIIAEANRLTAAVRNVGGANKLTAAEQSRVNATVTEAIAKYKALGQTAPASMLAIAKETERTAASGSGLGNLGKQAMAMAAGFVSAQVLIAAARAGIRLAIDEIKTLTLEGAAVADVTENFEHLTKQAGQLGNVLLTTLRAGTHNTITDFDLMTTVNEDLAAGLRLTDAQFGTLSKGAFALAQATGGDVKTALDTMNDAMLTGRTRSLAMLTGKINLSAAEKSFALSLLSTAEHLSEEGKLEAARVAILQAVGAATDRLGEQTDGLDERVAQAQTTWRNFEHELGRTIATSPVLEAAMVGIKDAILDTFGGDRQKLVAGIAQKFDEASIALIDLGQIGVASGRGLVNVLLEVSKLTRIVMQGFDGIRLAALYVQRTVPTGLGPLGDATRYKGVDEQIGRLLLTMKQRNDAMEADTRAQERVNVVTDAFNAKLDTVRTRMQAAYATKYGTSLTDLKASMEGAMRASVAHAGAADQDATATNTAAEAARRRGQFLQKSASELAAAKSAAEKMREAMEEANAVAGNYWDTLGRLDGRVVEGIKYYKEAGMEQGKIATLYGLTAVQVTAVVKALEQEAKVTKTLQELRDIENTVRPPSEGLAGLQDYAKTLHERESLIQESNERSIASREQTARTLRDIDLQRAASAIESAQQWGAPWQRVYAMETELSKRRLRAAIEDSNREFEARHRTLDKTGQEYRDLADGQSVLIQQMVEDWTLGEQRKRDELRITHNFWLQLSRTVRADLQDLRQSATRNLSGTLFGLGRGDPDGSLKKAAADARAAYEEISGKGTAAQKQVAASYAGLQSAQQAFDAARKNGASGDALQGLNRQVLDAKLAYQQISSTGKGSAKEIQDAFDRMREAEEAANIGFGKRFTNLWSLEIKPSLFRVFDDILGAFTNRFLDGMINAIAGRAGGFKAAFADMFSGGLSGLLGKNAKTAAAVVPSLLAGGGAAAAATTSMLGGQIAATTTALTAAEVAGVTSVGGIAAGTTAGTAGGAGASIAALATNPFTIAAAGGLALGLLIWKKGLFRGGEEGTQVNPRRDKFQLQNFGQPGDSVPRAGQRMAAVFTQWTGEPGGGRLWKGIQGAKKLTTFRTAESAVVTEAAKHGRKDINVFHHGGVIDGQPGREVDIRALVGEAMLTPRATQMIGGKPAVDALNAGVMPSALALGRAVGGRLKSLLPVMQPLSSPRITMPASINGGDGTRFVFQTEPKQSSPDSPRPTVINANLYVTGLVSADTARELHAKHLKRLHTESLFFDGDYRTAHRNAVER